MRAGAARGGRAGRGARARCCGLRDAGRQRGGPRTTERRPVPQPRPLSGRAHPPRHPARSRPPASRCRRFPCCSAPSCRSSGGSLGGCWGSKQGVSDHPRSLPMYAGTAADAAPRSCSTTRPSLRSESSMVSPGCETERRIAEGGEADLDRVAVGEEHAEHPKRGGGVNLRDLTSGPVQRHHTRQRAVRVKHFDVLGADVGRDLGAGLERERRSMERQTVPVPAGALRRWPRRRAR